MTVQRALLVVDDVDGAHRTLGERAASGLSAAGYEVTVVDLVRDRFEAAMTRREREAYHGPDPIVDAQVRESADLVASSEVLGFVHPSRMGGLPPRSKGWLERVLVPGVAFRFDESGRVRPALDHVRHLVGVATYDDPPWRVRALHDNARRTINRALRMSCGWRTRTTWLAAHRFDTLDDRQRSEFGARVERELAELA